MGTGFYSWGAAAPTPPHPCPPGDPPLDIWGDVFAVVSCKRARVRFNDKTANCSCTYRERNACTKNRQGSMHAAHIRNNTRIMTEFRLIHLRASQCGRVLPWANATQGATKCWQTWTWTALCIINITRGLIQSMKSNFLKKNPFNFAVETFLLRWCKETLINHATMDWSLWMCHWANHTQGNGRTSGDLQLSVSPFHLVMIKPKKFYLTLKIYG